MRASGIILHITSLPSPHGVGTLGREAREFADFLRRAGQKYWQILPLGPTGYGDSPYQTDSAFAGNPYLIDLEQLITDGLLTREEVDAVSFGSDPAQTDYGALYAGRFDLLRRACERGWDKERENVDAFYRENESWLRSYALYTAAKRHFGMRPWIEWEDEDLRLRRSEEVLRRYEELLAEDIRFCIFTQYLFFRQWNALRAYIREQGIRIIGDVPIYVPLDSADVWAEGEYFQLDDQCRPTEVAGVPPDYFSEDGQLWGNPLYDYEAMEKDGFGWWIRRVGGAQKLCDVLRIDHFRGFASYWAVPYGETTAKNGHWVKGPGMALVGVLTNWFRDLDFIAEDLGAPSPDVTRLLEDSGLPGMKVLEFAFDPETLSDYLPHSCGESSICYTGTHDNAPLVLWREEATEAELAFAKTYLGLNEEEGFCSGLLRGGMGCGSRLFIAQMQDWLEAGVGSRMNTPGTSSGNWQWRMLPGEASKTLAERIREMTRIYGRL